MSPDELGRRVWELRGPLMRLACAIVRRQQDAEDAVSEAVVRAFESLPALRCDAAVRPWLMKITARCATTACDVCGGRRPVRIRSRCARP